MKYKKNDIVLLTVISILIISLCGCSNNPIIPGTNPNPSVNPGNSTVSYIRVTASSETMEVNQSQQLVVKGYNSDDEWVILDKSKIILWKWTVTGQCGPCIDGLVSLSPTSNSLTTNFSSGAPGTFHVVAYYEENAEAEIISDYLTIQVTSKAKTIYDINPKSKQ